MNPFMPVIPTKDLDSQKEAQRLVSTAQDLLSGHPIKQGDIERSRKLLIKALGLNPCAWGGRALLVVAIALRATHHERLPSGDPNPYAVLGLIPDVPTARNLAFIEAYYRQASDLINRKSLNFFAHPSHPCYPAFSIAARLVADAWAFLSDADRKASLDSRFIGNQGSVPSHPPAATTSAAPPVAGHPPAATTTSAHPVASHPPAATTSAAPVTSVHPPAATTTPPSGDVAHGRGLRIRKRSVRLAGDEWMM